MEAARRTRAFAVRLALFYGALFLIYGMHLPYMPVWLDGRGLSASEISVISAAPFFIRLLVTPAVALAADRSGNHRAMLVALAWSSLLMVLILSQLHGFWMIFALAVPLATAFSTIMPLTETIAMSGVRHAGLDYGRVRLWGSLAFIGASFAGGFAIARYGSPAGIYLIAIGSAATIAAAHLLPRESLGKAPLPNPTPWWKAREPLQLLANSVFVTFLVAAGGIQAAHATFMTFGALIWQKQGLSGGWIGTLWAIGVLAEIAIFAASGWFMRTFGSTRLLMAGALSSVVRWVVMAFDPSLTVLVPLQVLHGLTYGAAHIGAIHFIGMAVPMRIVGTAQALYSTVAAGLAMGIAMMIAGRLYADFGTRSYLAMAVLAAVALVATHYLHMTWRRGLIMEEESQ